MIRLKSGYVTRIDVLDEPTRQSILRQRAEAGKTRRRFKKPPRMSFPLSLEAKYSRELRLVASEIQQEIINKLLVHLPDIGREFERETGRRLDDWVDVIGRSIDSMTENFNLIAKNFKPTAERTAVAVSMWNNKQWQKVVKTVMGVSLLQYDKEMPTIIKSFTNDNVALISKLTKDTSTDVSTIIQQGFRSGKRAGTIAQEIIEGTNLQKGVFSSVKTRAEFIARDQIAKLNADFTQMRQQNLGLDRYVWRTSLDERVRESHRVMENRLCTWKNPSIWFPLPNGKPEPRPMAAIHEHPGDDYNCRCYAEPYFEDLEPMIEERRTSLWA